MQSQLTMLLLILPYLPSILNEFLGCSLSTVQECRKLFASVSGKKSAKVQYTFDVTSYSGGFVLQQFNLFSPLLSILLKLMGCTYFLQYLM